MTTMDPDLTFPRYRVTRRDAGSGYVQVALISDQSASGDTSRGPGHHVMLAQRVFRARTDLFELESYARLLEHASEHGNRGTLGCFVEVEPERDGTVSVTLYERWFKGRHLLCERLAGRQFDASDEDALVMSAEYLVELQDQAAKQNQLYELAALDAGDPNRSGGHEADDSVKAAEWLAELLDDHCHPPRLAAHRPRS